MYLPGTGHSPKGWYGQEQAQRGQSGLELVAAQATSRHSHRVPLQSLLARRRCSILTPPPHWNLFVDVRAHWHPVTVTLQGVGEGVQGEGLYQGKGVWAVCNLGQRREGLTCETGLISREEKQGNYPQVSAPQSCL